MHKNNNHNNWGESGSVGRAREEMTVRVCWRLRVCVWKCFPAAHSAVACTCFPLPGAHFTHTHTHLHFTSQQWETPAIHEQLVHVCVLCACVCACAVPSLCVMNNMLMDAVEVGFHATQTRPHVERLSQAACWPWLFLYTVQRQGHARSPS